MSADLRWTPLHLKLMLHYYACVEAPPNPQAPAVIDYISDLQREGLIAIPAGWPEADEKRNVCTAKGIAFVTLLCQTPMPELWWTVDGRMLAKQS